MLLELSIKNFAIIDDIRIQFSEGLTILSGETGAGKSIIINAVNLLLGSRATLNLIRADSEYAEIEGLFEIASDNPAAAELEKQGYNISEDLIIRRIISRNKKHRIFINGRLSTVQNLNIITRNLASISSQHGHQKLLKQEHHLLILDTFAGLLPLRNGVYKLYHEVIPLINKLKSLNKQKKREAERVELLEYQKKEINMASIVMDEDLSLDQEKKRLKNSKILFQIIQQSIQDLYSDHGAVVEKLVEVKKNLEKITQIDPLLLSCSQEIDNASFQIQDVAEKLRVYCQSIETDETRISTIDDRLYILKGLKQKYGGTLKSVLLHLCSIEKEFSQAGDLAEEIAKTKHDLDFLHEKLREICTSLSKKRKINARILAEQVEKELSDLNMADTKLEILIQGISADKTENRFLLTEDNTTISDTGIDNAAFLIAPNVGETLKPLAEIASGGELSRIVLAIKALLVKTESVETVVFDEADAGIGGDVAEMVGKKLKLLAKYHQVICITHLPQIAKYADHHFKILKHVKNNRTLTTISLLNYNERINELARMLAGKKITRVILDHAAEMMQSKTS